MFNGRGDQMVPHPAHGPRRTDQCQVIAFRSPGCKYNFLCIDLQDSRKSLFCLFHIVLRLHAFSVHGGRIPIIPAHDSINQFADLRIAPGGRRIIQVNFHDIFPFFISYLQNMIEPGESFLIRSCIGRMPRGACAAPREQSSVYPCYSK